MQCQEEQLRASDGHNIPLYLWKTGQKTSKGLIQITHGLAEHGARYSTIAELLTDNGFDVVAHDHRGHGKASRQGILGYYADRDGWQKVVDDLHLVTERCKTLAEGRAHFLFAHSMGSFISMQYLMNYQPSLTGVILSGSNYSPPLKYLGALRIARLERFRVGARNRSKVLDLISFGSFNGHFKPTRTSHDWLSRDPKQVDAYLADEYCGFIATTQLWCDFFAGLATISKPANLKKLRSDTSMFLLAGEKDPVGGMGKGVIKLSEQLKQAGIKDLSCTLYPDGRHEMLNETNRAQVVQDILNWIAGRLPQAAESMAQVK